MTNPIRSVDRRTVVVAGILLPLAGCLDGDADDDTDDGETEGDTDEPDMDAIDDHLSDANGYDGDLQDNTGEDSLTIDVGDPDGGSDYRFDPVAPEIDTGTEVTWEWVDESTHSVTDQDGAFDSDVQADYSFEHTFDDAGTYLYYCQPHQAQGHLGAIVVY